MWILAQELPIAEYAEIAKRLDNIEIVFVIAMAALGVVTLVTLAQIRSQGDTNKSIRETNAAIRETNKSLRGMSKSLEISAAQSAEILKLVLSNDHEGDKFMNHRLRLLEEDYREIAKAVSILAKTTNEFMTIIRSVFVKDDTIAERIRDALLKSNTENDSDKTKPINDEVLNKI